MPHGIEQKYREDRFLKEIAKSNASSQPETQEVTKIPVIDASAVAKVAVEVTVEKPKT